MRDRNDGTDPINAVQNRFTAYLAQAVRRQKGKYLKKKAQKAAVESGIDPMEHENLWPKEVDMLTGPPPLAQVENQRLLRTLVGLTDREQYILLTHVLDERDFSVLSAKLGLGYKGVAAVYYRTVRKIKQELRG